MRTGRPRTFDREAAVSQAMHLFWEHGYESTSLAQLKAAIGRGITAPSFYAAFGSKEALFREAVDRYLTTHGRVTDSLWQADLPPRVAIETALLRSARMQCEPGHPQGCMVALGVMTACSAANKPLMQLLADSRQRTRSGLQRCLARGVETGELRRNSDIPALTVAFDGFLLGISTLARDGIPLAAIEGGITQIMTLWDNNRADNLPRQAAGQ
ncbi:TetR family transcriptional regulator [Candidatus Sodalis pierantonius str. SOPE]|uniref:TetR family transcriptional regulator n=2 Tax=Sodalis TaxID=84565 RepID=W0HNA8_9GAMM|nr:TetR family transcriptional regulator [Candidatus Sodalis pierantonius str. SOPE]